MISLASAESVRQQPGNPGEDSAGQPAKAGQGVLQDLLTRVGQLTRTLHESLRQVGPDSLPGLAAATTPEPRERLACVAGLNAEAVKRVRSAAGHAAPLQDRMETGALALTEDWRRVLASNGSIEDYRGMARRLLDYLSEVPTLTRATRDHLSEITLVQEAPELAGDLIEHIGVIVYALEQDLLGLLADCAAAEENGEGRRGAAVNARGVVPASPSQAEDLLRRLGF